MNLSKSLNKAQQRAVKYLGGPALVLASVGTGKTRVIAYRVAYLVSEKSINPENIVVVTFTDKAADKMKEQVTNILGKPCGNIWFGTFYSLCARILRQEHERLGWSQDFLIYNSEERLTLVKKIMEELNISDRNYSPDIICTKLSDAKTKLISYVDYKPRGENQLEELTLKVYRHYQQKIKEYNVLDVDDLIMKTVELFQSNPEVLDKYSTQFRHILVDEFQDITYAQYQLIKLLANKHHNLYAVGDDDQSIYGWLGTDLSNIQNFAQDYPETKIIKLEQNYRSTKNILEAALLLIQHNRNRTLKVLWTKKPKGNKITLLVNQTQNSEARAIVKEIKEIITNESKKLKDFVILYRNHTQSRALEDALKSESIPYSVVGGIKFQNCKEIKDILSYLKLILNPDDSESLLHIINVPRRGISKTVEQQVTNYATQKNITLFQCLNFVDQINEIPEPVKLRLKNFYHLINEFISKKSELPVHMLIQTLLEKLNYIKFAQHGEINGSDARTHNVKKLLDYAQCYITLTDNPRLADFLSQICMLNDIDGWDDTQDAATLMTLYNAKGLEFPVVFICGMEEGVFPHATACQTLAELEEERRLCYVGMTRASEKLYISYARRRHQYNTPYENRPSRFIREIPADYFDRRDEEYFTLTGISLSIERLSPSEFETEEIIEEEPTDRLIDTEPLCIGDSVIHPNWGIGVIEKIEGLGDEKTLTIVFDNQTRKKVLAKYTYLHKI